MSKRHFWKKIKTTFSQKAIFGILTGFFFQEWRLLILSVPLLPTIIHRGLFLFLFI